MTNRTADGSSRLYGSCYVAEEIDLYRGKRHENASNLRCVWHALGDDATEDACDTAWDLASMFHAFFWRDEEGAFVYVRREAAPNQAQLALGETT